MNTIEERLEKLENLSDSIKDSDLGIEEAMALFDEGIKLVRGIEKDLDEMEGKIQILMNQPEDTDDVKTKETETSRTSSKSKKTSAVKAELELFNFEPKNVSHE